MFPEMFLATYTINYKCAIGSSNDELENLGRFILPKKRLGKGNFCKIYAIVARTSSSFMLCCK